MAFLLFSLKLNGFQFEQPTKFIGLWNPAQQTTTSRSLALKKNKEKESKQKSVCQYNRIRIVYLKFWAILYKSAKNIRITSGWSVLRAGEFTLKL